MVAREEIIEAIEILKEFQKGKRKTTLNREAKDSKNFTPYQTLISCLLSLRAKDEITEKISLDLFKIADTPEKIINLKKEQLKKIIFSSGHYNKKSEAIIHVSKEIIERFNSKVPETFEELMSIKHIGPKTANLVLSFCFGKEAIVVDTHVHRIPNRIGWISTKNPEQTEKELMKILPREYWREINGILVLFGRTICLPISPWCSKCPIKDYCRRINVERSR